MRGNAETHDLKTLIFFVILFIKISVFNSGENLEFLLVKYFAQSAKTNWWEQIKWEQVKKNSCIFGSVLLFFVYFVNISCHKAGIDSYYDDLQKTLIQKFANFPVNR